MTKLRYIDEDNVLFFCPGCQGHVLVPIGGDDPWLFNGDDEHPSFSPSLVHENNGFHCHSFVSHGIVQYLNDCTHPLAGKNAVIPDMIPPKIPDHL